MIQIADKLSEIEDIKKLLNENLPHKDFNLGKMIRSKIGIMFLKLYGIETNKFIPFLTCIELIHNASLLHDDVIDDETERRGESKIGRASCRERV